MQVEAAGLTQQQPDWLAAQMEAVKQELQQQPQQQQQEQQQQEQPVSEPQQQQGMTGEQQHSAQTQAKQPHEQNTHEKEQQQQQAEHEEPPPKRYTLGPAEQDEPLLFPRSLPNLDGWPQWLQDWQKGIPIKPELLHDLHEIMDAPKRPPTRAPRPRESSRRCVCVAVYV